MSRQRVSFSIQEVPDQDYLLDVLKQLKPFTIGVIDNPALLVNILNAVPEIEIGWHRFTEGGEAELWTNDSNFHQLIDAFRGAGLHNHPRAWLYMMNEPVAHGKDLPRMTSWMVRAMTAARSAGIKCVMGNLGSAVYQKLEIDSGAFDEYLRKLDEWRDTMIAGFHEYGPPILPMGAAGRTTNDAYHLDPAMTQPDHWPSPWDVQVSGRQNGSLESNYFIGRIYWWDERANHIGVRPPRKLITEAGQDRLDIKNVYDEIGKKYSPLPFLTVRGINTLRRYYDAIYPQWGFERANLEMFKWLAWIYDDTIYRNQPVPSVEGVNLFVWTRPDKPEWGKDYGFDYSELRGIHRLLIDWTREIEQAVQTKTAVSTEVVEPQAIKPAEHTAVPEPHSFAPAGGEVISSHPERKPKQPTSPTVTITLDELHALQSTIDSLKRTIDDLISRAR